MDRAMGNGGKAMAKVGVRARTDEQTPLVVGLCPLCGQKRTLNVKWRGGCYCYTCGMSPDLRRLAEEKLGLFSPGSSFVYESSGKYSVTADKYGIARLEAAALEDVAPKVARRTRRIVVVKGA